MENMRANQSYHRAFSLVELSIVLVILGLLTGGILTGQSLIRASELRAVTSEHQRYSAAIMTFRDKYFAMPGDMSNATRFWGRQNTGGDCVTNSAAAVNATAGTCDGNGNSLLDNPAAVSQSTESFQGWRQLAFAGLVEGSYTGYTTSLGLWNVTADNSPKSKLSNGLWGYSYATPLTGHTSVFDRSGNYFTMQLGSTHPTGGGNRVPVLRPEEAWNIDTKIDDGKPATGSVLARSNEDSFGFSDFTTATASNQITADYLLSRTDITVALAFRL